ncbi:myelin-associated glycoprotein-like [Heterodontus francisci]|uniref:myelin-associated glycoprotein-like n=1 Tax=Heterodontus francisci TaxID=7792 RepID=UPI00355BE640
MNKHGTSTKSVNITVLYSPKETTVRVRGAQHGIREGDNVTLTCSSRSNPPVTNYSWFRTDRSNRTEVMASAETINLGPVTRDDDAWFYCRAQNALGSSNSPGLFISAEYKPEISRESTCARRAEGVTCVCMARSNPPGDLTWQLPHANVSGNQTQGGFVAWQVVDGHLVTGSLALTGHQGEEDVTAFCTVRNPHGEAMFKVYLWVKGESPDHFHMILCVLAGALGMLILSLILCRIIVCCRRKTKPAAVTDAEMEVLAGQVTPVLAASLVEVDVEVEEEGGEEVGSLTEEVSEAGSLKPEENGEAAGSEAETQLQELHYACIDFSKARSCDAVVGTRDSTQYAEIKLQ